MNVFDSWLGGSFVRGDGLTVNSLQVAAAAKALNETIGQNSPIINNCSQRSDFAATLLGAAMAGQPCLLPGSNHESVIHELVQRYPGSRVVSSISWPSGGAEHREWQPKPDQLAVISFTSGSTGEPKPVLKSWRNLLGASSRLQAACDLSQNSHSIVATVPAQHMYGLETSILTGLIGPHAISDKRPFFAADVFAELEAMPAPRCLITTPIHLHAIMGSGLRAPPLEMVMSATAPLDRDFARQVERAWGCRVCEIYGSTETGAVASRTVQMRSTAWLLFPGIRFSSKQTPKLTSTHLPQRPTLPDRVSIIGPQKFELLGRPDNMLKVGGKRSSTDAIVTCLLAIDGVHDAAVIHDPSESRPWAVVVAPSLSTPEIRRALASKLDPVFIPRPIKRVDALPRNATGKLQLAELRNLRNRLRRQETTQP